MTVLVTGSQGFLGTHLLNELKTRRPGLRVAALSRTPAPGAIVCDLLDEGAVRRVLSALKPRAIFHLAGSTAPLGPEALWQANVTATINLLEAVRRLPAPQRVPVILCGSAGEYGAPGSRPVPETAPARPVTVYGSVKLSQTLAALSYRHQGLDVRVARVFNAIGPGIPVHLALGAFLEQLRRIEGGLQPPVLRVGRLSSRRDFLDARDLARALVDIQQRGEPGQVYNACSGRAVPVGDLLLRLIELSGLKVELRVDPSRLKQADIPLIVGDRRKLAARTGWRPRISLDRSLQDCLAWQRGR